MKIATRYLTVFSGYTLFLCCTVIDRTSAMEVFPLVTVRTLIKLVTARELTLRCSFLVLLDRSLQHLLCVCSKRKLHKSDGPLDWHFWIRKSVMWE